MAATTIHSGSLDSLAPNSSRGLKFVTAFLTEVDSLAPDRCRRILPFMRTNATFYLNSPAAIDLEKFLSVFQEYTARLSAIRRLVHTIWDIELEGGVRTVVCESTGTIVFTPGEEEREARFREFLVFELDEMEDGYLGLGVVECRVAKGMRLIV